jgi:hypothetical protein
MNRLKSTGNNDLAVDNIPITPKGRFKYEMWVSDSLGRAKTKKSKRGC